MTLTVDTTVQIVVPPVTNNTVTLTRAAGFDAACGESTIIISGTRYVSGVSGTRSVYM